MNQKLININISGQDNSLFILEAVAAWTNPKRKERRTCHHDGSGVFYIDGERLNLRKRMTKWEE